MQDRFKFRGKRSDNGEWVIGGLCEIPPPPQCIGEISPSKFCIFCEHPNTLTDWGMPRQMCLIDVDPDTVGQCTGLHAAKSYRGESEEDRLIFEGDVIRFYDNPIHEGVKCKCIYADWRSGFLYEFLTGEDKGKFTDMHDTWRKSEIIGTIHDRNEGEE